MTKKTPWKTCPQCLIPFAPRHEKSKYCTRKCAFDAKVGRGLKGDGVSKGWIDDRGYRWVFVRLAGQRREMREHRFVMETHLGRRLEPFEVVHHINGNRTDNRVKNLRVMDPGAHSSEASAGSSRSDLMRARDATMARAREEVKRLRRSKALLLAALASLIAQAKNGGPIDIDVAQSAQDKATEWD